MKRLLVHFGHVGDLVMLTPLMRQLARSGPLELLCRPWGRELLEGQRFVGPIHTLRKPNVRSGPRRWLFGPARAALGRRLATRGLEEIVVFDREKPVIRRWVERFRGEARVTVCELGFGRTVSRRALETGGFGPAALDGFDETPHLEPDPDEVERTRALLAPLGRRIVALHPGGSVTRSILRRRPHLKGLPPPLWAGLAAGILRRGEADAILLTGTAAERREARAILRLLPPDLARRAHDATGRFSLPALLAALSLCRALASIDTGPAHMAAAVSCPLLDVFGPTDPELFLPFGRAPVEAVLGTAPCQFCHGTPLWKRCPENVCLSRLPLERLEAGWSRLLARLPA